MKEAGDPIFWCSNITLTPGICDITAQNVFACENIVSVSQNKLFYYTIVYAKRSAHMLVYATVKYTYIYEQCFVSVRSSVYTSIPTVYLIVVSITMFLNNRFEISYGTVPTRIYFLQEPLKFNLKLDFLICPGRFVFILFLIVKA